MPRLAKPRQTWHDSRLAPLVKRSQPGMHQPTPPLFLNMFVKLSPQARTEPPLGPHRYNRHSEFDLPSYSRHRIPVSRPPTPARKSSIAILLSRSRCNRDRAGERWKVERRAEARSASGVEQAWRAKLSCGLLSTTFIPRFSSPVFGFPSPVLRSLLFLTDDRATLKLHPFQKSPPRGSGHGRGRPYQDTPDPGFRRAHRPGSAHRD